MAPTPVESSRFPAASADFPTKVLTGLTLGILGALVLGGIVQVGVSVGGGDALGVARGAGYGTLAWLGIVFTLARVPKAYRVELDTPHGSVLVVERRWSGAVRLALDRYGEVVAAKRVIFPWVPMLSGTRVFGLRGARIEESLAGFWSFGRDGRRVLIFSGPGRPRTLVAPADPQAFLEALARCPGAPRPVGPEPVAGEGSRGATAAGSALGDAPQSAEPSMEPQTAAVGVESDTLEVGGSRIVLKKGDITTEEADAVVNAANPSLMGGGGVDGAIHGAGGPGILEECLAIVAALGPLSPGEAVATTAGLLAEHGVSRVIHTVGPVWRGGGEGEEVVLRRAYRSSLTLAVEEGLQTVVFPSISTGAYGYPAARAAAAALGEVSGFLRENPDVLREVRFVLYDEETLGAYRSASRLTTGS